MRAAVTSERATMAEVQIGDTLQHRRIDAFSHDWPISFDRPGLSGRAFVWARLFTGAEWITLAKPFPGARYPKRPLDAEVVRTMLARGSTP